MHHFHTKDFWLCFVPLFVAVDLFGTLPIFASLIANAEPKRVDKAIRLSVVTALLVALSFVFLGEWVLRLLGITVADFLIAGGIILMLLAIRDLLSPAKQTLPADIEGLGPVPLGVPLIVGPAVLTTIMLLVPQYGYFMTAVTTAINVVLAGLAFYFSGKILRTMGNSGVQIASKVANLFLAAIAVMMARKGLVAILSKGIFGW